MSARKLLDELIRARGDSYASISALLGRNSAYIQQFIKRGTPRNLSLGDEAILARYFELPSDFMRRSDQAKLHLAAALVRRAISICDEAGLTLPQCHFQLGLDTMPNAQPLE
jgi:hypothetical protein